MPSMESGDIRQQLAEILLLYARVDEDRRPRLSQQEMAAFIGTSKVMVNNCLKSLQAEGTIRIDRHRLIINKEELERIAMEAAEARAYALLRTRNGNSDSAAAIVRRQVGVVMVDLVEGPADIIFAVQAPDRERLAGLMVRTMASLEAVTDDIQLLPVKEVAAPERTAITE